MQSMDIDLNFRKDVKKNMNEERKIVDINFEDLFGNMGDYKLEVTKVSEDEIRNLEKQVKDIDENGMEVIHEET